MRILLLAPEPSRSGISVTRLPPLGILSIAAFLRANKYEVEVWDRNIEPTRKIDFSNYDLLGISVSIGNVERGAALANEAKKINPSLTIVFGGPFCLADPRPLMAITSVDIIVTSEGETCLYDLLRLGRPEQIPGLWYRNCEGQWVYTGERPWIQDLDSLPFPALDLVRLNLYNRPISLEKPISTIFTSRGCPSACIFCFPAMGKIWRARSPKHVVDEIEWQVSELGVRELCIEDDNFTFSPERASEICDLIIDHKIKVKLQLRSGIRADRVNYELVKKLKAAGTWLISLSPESGNLETLKKIKKGFELKEVEKVVSWCKEVDIRTFSCYILGFPWETKSEMYQTVRYALDLDTDFIQVSRAMALPRTNLYEMVKNDLKTEACLSDASFLFGGVKHPINVSEREFNLILKMMYRKFYAKPQKIISILRTLSLGQVIRLGSYSVTSGNI